MNYLSVSILVYFRKNHYTDYVFCIQLSVDGNFKTYLTGIVRIFNLFCLNKLHIVNQSGRF
jgi:hypothetical protein